MGAPVLRPVDLERLKAAAERTDGGLVTLTIDESKSALVDRSYLAQIHAELIACRVAEAASGRCFGLPDGQRL